VFAFLSWTPCLRLFALRLRLLRFFVNQSFGQTLLPLTLLPFCRFSSTFPAFPRFSFQQELSERWAEKPLSMFTAMYVRHLNSPRCISSPHVFVAITTPKCKRLFRGEKVRKGGKRSEKREMAGSRGKWETLPPSQMFALLCLTHKRALTARRLSSDGVFVWVCVGKLGFDKHFLQRQRVTHTRTQTREMGQLWFA